MKVIIILVLFSIQIAASLASSLFVDPTNGHDDTGNGTMGNPYKTIWKVGWILNNTHCDTIYILGSYHYGVKDELIRNDNQTYWIYVRPYNDTNVTLDGLGSIPDSWKAILGVQSSKYVDIKNITVTRNDSASGFRVVSDNRISQYVHISNCRANNCRRQGILIQAKDVTVENCEIDSVCLRNRFGVINENEGWDAALSTYLYQDTLVWCSNITFRNNYVHNVWGEGIAVERARNFLIENNRVRECYSACIYADNSRYGVIQRNWLSINNDYYNRQYDPSYIARASGIFWASENAHHLDSIIQNIDICNNLIWGTGPAFGWFDDEANPSWYDSYRKINIYYNTVFNTKSYMTFYIDTLNVNPYRILPDSCNFKNNIICRAKWLNQYERYFTYSNDFDTASHRWTVKNNCFIHGLDPRFVNNITGPPSFVDSNSNSPDGFKIAMSSNCKDAGIVVSQYTTDYWQAGRDSTPSIGFHEYGGVAIITPIGNEIPTQFALWQNYPNPFNQVTIIQFDLPRNALTKLSMFDLTGRLVKIIFEEELKAGSYKYMFEGSTLASGVYFYKLEANDFSEAKKMVLIK